MSEFKKRNTITKYLNILLERTIIALKSTKEYKLNLYLLIFNYTFTFLTMFLFLDIYSSIIGNILSWSKLDFLLYFLLSSFSLSSLFIISLLGFKTLLLSGNLNNYLIRPTNPYIMANLNFMTGHNIILCGIYFIIFFILSFFYKYMLLGVLFLLFGVFYFILFWNFLRSFAFFFKNIKLVYKSIWDFNEVIVSYTPVFFNKISFTQILFLMPASIYGYITLEIIKGNFNYFFDYIFLILLSTICLILGNYILWKFGLKNMKHMDNLIILFLSIH